MRMREICGSKVKLSSRPKTSRSRVRAQASHFSALSVSLSIASGLTVWCMEGDVDSDDSSGSENELQQQVEQLQAAVRIIPFNAQLRVIMLQNNSVTGGG